MSREFFKGLKAFNPPERIRPTQERPLQILHLLPPGIDEERLKFHGSTKDFRNRTEYFRERGFNYHEIVFPKNDETLTRWLQAFDIHHRPLSSYSHVILDMPGSYPRSIRALKRLAPRTRVIFRSHNAEFFHRLDWANAEKSPKERLKLTWLAIRAGLRDLRLMRSADLVAPISDWDTYSYWKPLARLARRNPNVTTWPYYLPHSIATPSPSAVKENLCVCLGAPNRTGKKGVHGPLIRNLYARFSDEVSALPEATRVRWRFALTGDPPADLSLSSAIEVMGFLDSPFAALEKAKVVCLLSELGRGFKTKILDAIAARAFVILPRTLYERLPLEVRPLCLVAEGEGGLERALALADKGFPDFDANYELKIRAFAAMDEVFKPREW